MLIYAGVTSIDITGVETLVEIRRSLEVQEIKVIDISYFMIISSLKWNKLFFSYSHLAVL